MFAPAGSPDLGYECCVAFPSIPQVKFSALKSILTASCSARRPLATADTNVWV